MKTWTNDYGDIPWWYWPVAREVWRLTPRPARHDALVWSLLAGIASVPAHHYIPRRSKNY